MRQLPQSSGCADYSENFMTKFVISKRTDSRKTDVNLLNRRWMVCFLTFKNWTILNLSKRDEFKQGFQSWCKSAKFGDHTNDFHLLFIICLILAWNQGCIKCFLTFTDLAGCLIKFAEFFLIVLRRLYKFWVKKGCSNYLYRLFLRIQYVGSFNFKNSFTLS